MLIDTDTFIGNNINPSTKAGAILKVQNADNRVGINTLSPSTALHVSGDIRHSTVYTFATLPSASGIAGTRTFVSDATGAATVGTEITAGGGSLFLPVYSDGTVWRIG
jgi:hypothetical protein